jgi:hypothetical protein
VCVTRVISWNTEYVTSVTSLFRFGIHDSIQLGLYVLQQRLQAMSKQGILPARLGKCPTPLCAACFYGKATKQQTRTKTPESILPNKKITQPGQVISVDCLTLDDAGLVAQMTGNRTHARYKHVIIFVDHYSDLSYVHLLKKQDAEEVIQAKETFETYAGSFEIDVHHYHTDNGIFNAKE